MATFPLSRTVLKPIGFEWFEEDDMTRIVCTGFSCAVEQTTLPWTPAVTPVDAALGKFQIAAATAPQAAALVAGKRYGLKIVMRNGAGAAIEEFVLTVVAE